MHQGLMEAQSLTDHLCRQGFCLQTTKTTALPDEVGRAVVRLVEWQPAYPALSVLAPSAGRGTAAAMAKPHSA